MGNEHDDDMELEVNEGLTGETEHYVVVEETPSGRPMRPRSTARGNGGTTCIRPRKTLYRDRLTASYPKIGPSRQAAR